jgi:hypothetical protein
MTIQQGPLETPLAFLQRLKDALQKHTNIILESQEEEIVLKDKFLTVSTREALLTALREASPGQSLNLRRCFQHGQAGHFRRECCWRKLPSGPCPICRGKRWKAHCPWVPRETKARAYQMTGPGASHPGSCGHHKSRGAPGFTHY